MASKYSVCRWQHVGCSTSIFVFDGNGILSRNASVFIHWSTNQYGDRTILAPRLIRFYEGRFHKEAVK